MKPFTPMRTEPAQTFHGSRQHMERISLLEAALQNISGGLMLYDRNLLLAYCNDAQHKYMKCPYWFFAEPRPTIMEVFHYNAQNGEYGPGDPAALVELRMQRVAKGERHVFEHRRPNGTLLEVMGTPLQNGGFLSTCIDITEQKKGHDALKFLASHDVLTNLPNRTSGVGELKRRLASAGRDNCLAVLFIDLDGFKPINDTYGHAMGDELLKTIGRRLSLSVRDKDHVCRYGGDEFLVIMNCPLGRTDARDAAERIRKVLSEPAQLGGIGVTPGASIGVAVCPDDGTDAERIIEAADKNMYVAKKRRVNPSNSLPPHRPVPEHLVHDRRDWH